MVITLMTPAFADDEDGQHREQAKRENNSKQQIAAAVTQQAVVMGHSPNSSTGFKHIPVNLQPTTIQSHVQQSNVQARPQPQIQNAPVGNRTNNAASVERFHTPTNQQVDSKDRHDRSVQAQTHRNDYANNRNDYANNGRNLVVSGGLGSDGYIRSADSNLTNRGYIRADNSNLSSDGYIRTNQTRTIQAPTINQGNSHGTYMRNRGNQGWQNQGRMITQYRMPYRQGYSDRYRVNYTRSWPTNYGWRVHGWSRDYREADPYWFAVITSIALAQAWSDAEVAQAINDDNLRQQLIYDEDIRQQMIASGYPADQVDYPSDDYDDNSNGYPPAGYDNPYDLNTTYPSQNSNGYALPPASSNPNSPLYNGAPLASGDQVANRNANQNVLFFCNAGNKQKTAEAFRQIQSPDMSVWKTLESFNKCRSWAVLP